ncbi:MAG TPA: CRTAC1 family protein, partial [Anaerolineae bacterium]|nr:CRTAC1 family protein [Anaerolineae bacterium]
GATFADYDNDGRPDLYVLNWGANTLFHNEGENGFRDVTREAGVGDSSNGKTAAWGDYDGDGYLDLYVANWACVPKCGRAYEGDKDRLYHNNGDGTFSDVTNLLPGGKTRGAGFVASFVDYDNDGDPDIYLVNDEFVNPVGNALWRNDGPGCAGWCFTDVSEAANADTRVMGMGLATADYDRDGDLDLYFSNAGPMTLLQNQGDGTFRDVAEAAGVQFPQGVGWGSVFFDYNNDGWLDLYLALMQGATGGRPPNPLFRNNGDGTFTNLAFDSGAGNIGRSIGVAYADYDRDGWVDLVVGNYDEGYYLYRNTLGETSSNNWLTLKLVGAGPVNRDAVGARVWLTDSYGRTQLQEVKNGSSLGSGNTLALHFGLGRAKAALVEIRWPDGAMQRIENVPANQEHEIVYGRDLTFKQAIPPATAAWIMAAILGLALAGVWFLKHRSRWAIWQIALLVTLAACAQSPSLAAVPPPTAVPSTPIPTTQPTSRPAAIPSPPHALTPSPPPPPTAVPTAANTPIPTPEFTNPLDEAMKEEAESLNAAFTLLDETNTGIWQYAGNSFLHPIALAAAGGMAYMVDGGRVLALDLREPASPQLLLSPGDEIEGVPVLEPYDLAFSDDQLLVLDRSADVYRYDLSSQTWTVERYDRPVNDTSSHYYVALAANPANNDRVLLETSYDYVLAYAPDEPERIFIPDDARAIDVSAVNDRFYVLAQKPFADTAVAALYVNGNTIYRFAPNTDIIQPRQIWATDTAVYLLDENGRRLLTLHPDKGYVQQITQLPPEVSAFAIDPASGNLILAGKERLYFPNRPEWWQTIPGGPTLPDPQPHDPDWLANLPDLLMPIQGSGLPNRDLQLPGAP